MSDLSNEPPIPDDSDNHDEKTSSQTMLVTLMLLIAGLALTSTMMLHYGAKKAGMKDGKTLFSFDMAALIPKSPSPEPAPIPVEKPEENEPIEPDVKEISKESRIGKLFANRSDKVRWPKLILTGFGSSTDGNGGFAIINGNQVHPGQLIDDKIALVEVRSHDVVVEYMGETKILTVNVKN